MSTETPVVSPSVAPVVYALNRKAVTTSYEIARTFEKQHKNVIQAINLLEIPNDFRKLNFQPNKIKVLNHPSGEEIESYHITRDGFTLLAFGFTGKKAMQFKLAYIEAFNRMEKELMNPLQVIRFDVELLATVHELAVQTSREMMKEMLSELKLRDRQIARALSEAADVIDPLNHTCPECGGSLSIHRNKRDRSLFLGCNNYPDCGYTENLRGEAR